MARFCIHVFALALLASFRYSARHCLAQENPPAMFVFGDSLFDAGNNNFINTNNNFKANFRPYGETSFPIPTGRFSDGFLIPDFIAKLAKKPLVPPYLATKNGPFINGVNFASAGSGSLNETNAGLVLSLKTQLGYFKNVSQQLKLSLGANRSKILLKNAVYMFSTGSNDYSTFVSNSTLLNSYTKNDYVNMVVGNMSTVFQEIYKEGGMKFVILSVGALGCVPSARAATNNGDCLDILQTLSNMHNEALQKMINILAKKLQGFKYSYFDYFKSSIDTFNNPSKYGLKEVKTACCGSGPFRGEPSCGGQRGKKEFVLCSDVENYTFFDYNHPSGKANHLSAILLWDGSTYVSPQNVKSLFLLNLIQN